jgi:hypothetical protein
VTIVSTDIELRYSGGAGNTTAGSALGGAMSTAGGGTVDTTVANDLFDDVSAAEAVTDDVEYRGIYVSVISAAVGTLTAAKIYISADSANADDIIDLAIADEALNATIETIANESTAPVGPTFSHPTTYAGGIAIGDMVANDERGVWVRRSIDGSPSQADPGAITNTLKVEGTTV